MIHHAITHRNVLCGGLIYAALGAFQIAHAAFVEPEPPPGFSRTTEGFHYRGQWIDTSARSTAHLTVSGKRIPIPVDMHMGPNAAKTAARFIFRHPLMIPASILAPLIIDRFIYDGQNWVELAPSQQTFPISDGFLWGHNNPAKTTPVFNNSRSACDYWVSRAIPGEIPNQYIGATCGRQIIEDTLTSDQFRLVFNGQEVWTYSVARRGPSNCAAGWHITPQGCLQTIPPNQTIITEQSFVDRLAPSIPLALVPNLLPDNLPIPVQFPVLNPEPYSIVPVYPAPLPRSRALLVPLSDPLPIPHSNPQQWRQPLLRISPSPTLTQPFRVSIAQFERVTASAAGINQPILEDSLTTDPANPTPVSNFCIENPNVLACAPVPEFDIPEEELTTRTEIIDYQPEHFMSGGSCPRIVTASIGGQTITIWDTPQYCQFISSYFRPVLLAIAAFTSMMIVAGGFRSV